MPKINGTSVLGILAATIGFYMVGFLFYGVIFMEKWMTLAGVPMDGEVNPMTYVWGLLITLLQVLGLNYILQHAGAKTLATCAKISLIVAVLIPVVVVSYAMIYAGAPSELFLIDAAHMLLGYVLAGIILSFFRGKGALDA